MLKAVAGRFDVPESRAVLVIAEKPADLSRLGADRLARRGWKVRALIGIDDVTLHDELSRYPGTGVIVVDARSSCHRRQWRTFRKMIFHLAEHDLWVALRSQPAENRPEVLVQNVLARDADREPWKSVGSIEVTPRYVAVQTTRAHLLKVRDHGATDLLNQREPELLVTELATLPAGRLTFAGTVTDYGATPEGAFPSELEFPQAALRRYDGRVDLPAASLATHRRSVLPDSFRWHQTPNPVNRGVRNLNAHFVNPKPRPSGTHLPGSHYFLYYNNPGHFGHLMTEAVAKLWGWDAAKADDPEVKLLCREHPRKPGTVASRLEHVLLPAYGVEPADVVWATGPVTVDRLYGVTPLWHNAPPYYAHPAIRDDWQRLRDGLPAATVEPTPKVFVSRPTRGNRACRNTRTVEEVFARHGFAIVRPELMSIPEQAALFRQARVVAGFGGSGLFNLVYSEAVETLVVLNQSSYEARNEHLFASVLGLDTHVFWSVPEEPSHQAAWSFDIDLNGRALEELLGQL